LRSDPALRRRILAVALPGVGERFVLNAALLLYFRLLSDFGSVAVAAYTIGIRFLSFTWIPGTGFGSAAATLVGQALGADRIRDAVSSGWLAVQLALGTSLAMGAICILGADGLASLFSKDPALIAELGGFIVALGLMQPFLQLQFALSGAHRGAGDSWTPFLASGVGACAVRVPLAAAAVLGLEADIRWLWGALVLDHVVRAVWLGVSFLRMRWTRIRA
jgi:Na+-driven multidrug efflux pump